MSFEAPNSAGADLLGGAKRVLPRDRGFVEWRPYGKSRILLEHVRSILSGYRDFLPVTIRQIFYRLVVVHDYPKDEKGYKRLVEMLTTARRGRAIEMDAIRDDGGHDIEPTFYADADDFLDSVRRWSTTFRLDRTLGQETRLIVMCEAGGMAPQLARVTNEYGIRVISGGGFDSVTKKHELAQDLGNDDRPVEVLHIGDHDPSGVHLFLALSEDITAFAEEYGVEIEFTRLAVTPAQIVELTLPTSIKKSTDNRAFNGRTAQAEAIAPDVMSTILRSAIDERIDRQELAGVLKRETRIRRELANRLSDI